MSDAADDEFAGLPEDEEEFDEAGEEGGEEAGSGDGDDGSVDSSEEEEDGENEYEADGFVVDEDEAEGDGEGEASDQEVRKAKKKKRRRQQFALDEEDYELLEDNQVRVKRPAERKRLKRRGEDRDPGKEKAAGAKQLQEALFGTDALEDDELADVDGRAPSTEEGGQGERRNRYDDFGEDISDEMDDFIVDGEDGERRRARRKRDARMAQAAGLSTAAMQAANRLFGNFGELLDLHQSHRAVHNDAQAEEDSDVLEEEQEEEGLDDYEADRRRQERSKARRQQRLLAQVDPELVDSHYLRPVDQIIRTTDIPERLQLLGKSVFDGVPEEGRRPILDEAARWVAEHLFYQHSQASKVREVLEDGVLEVTGECPTSTVGGLWPKWMLEETDSDLDLRNNRALLVRRGRRHPGRFMNNPDQLNQEERRLLDRWRQSPEARNAVISSVRTVLEHVFEKHEEIPLQAMYRKEGCGELLSMRTTDRPETTGNEEKLQSEVDIRHPKGTIQAKHRCIRRWDIMWAVFNWGVRFMELHKRRQKRIEAYNRMFEEAETEELKDALAACHDMLLGQNQQQHQQKVVHTAVQVDDVDTKFRRLMEIMSALGQGGLENGDHGNGDGLEKSTTKRPGRPSNLRRYIQLGLDGAAHQVSLTMEQFRENCDRREAVHMPEDPDVPPLEWAKQQIADRGLDDPEEAHRIGDFSRPESFLGAIKDLLAGELMAEPCLRQIVRSELYQHAILNTSPTKAGEDTLDPFHPLGITKHLVDKPVRSLEDQDTWLRILAAEKQGLIKLSLDWPQTRMEDTVADISEWLVSDNIAVVSGEWNQLRREVLEIAVRVKLLPVLLQELRAKLTGNAIETALFQLQDRFWSFVSQPPVRIMEVPDEQDQEPVQMEAPRFMAVVWGPGQAGEGPTTIVQLDGNGNLKDLLTAPQLSGNVPRTVNSGTREAPLFDPAADPKKSRDSHKIREKILEHKPNAILVSTSAPQSKQIKDDMEKISQYTESDARFKDELLPHLENKRVEVMWADDRIAALWANSEAAKAEFPDYSFLVRKAVGLGRMALDPLALIATLCGRRKEVLSLKLHELQDKLPREILAQRLEQTLITAVAQVGVDINAMAANTWRQAPLQFVPGLGPRKARALLAAIAANDNHIKTRIELLKQDGNAFGTSTASDVQQMGNNVFRNAAPFLRVRRGEVAALQNEEEFDALDDARIHPEDEALLQVILEEAFPDLVEAGTGVDVRTAIEQPGNLQQLDLWSVADANNHLFKLPTLVDMLQELLAPYGELRLTSAVPSDEAAFLLRHGETEESLKPGKLVEAKVVWIGETEVKVVVQNNGMEAIIPQHMVSSNDKAPELQKIFRPGNIITARIYDTGTTDTGVDEQQRRRYLVRLSTQSAYLQDFKRWEDEYCKKLDHSYRPPAGQHQQQHQQQQQQLKSRGRDRQVIRMIEHPLWRNVKSTEIAAELAAAAPGKAYFRPAHRHTLAEQLSRISLTVKLGDLATGPLIQNVEVKENPKKPPKQPRLVTPLTIELAGQNEPETYEDLDEVIARYVDPMVDRVREVSSHRKCIDGDTEAIEEWVRGNMMANPNQAVYCVALDGGRPGSGFIAYGTGGPKSGVYKEHFTIVPDGFFFRGKMWPTVEHVVSAFKQDPNYKKKQALTLKMQEQQQMAAAGQVSRGYGQPTQQQQMQQPAYGAMAQAAQAAASAQSMGYGQPRPGMAYGGGQPAPAAAAYGAPAGGGYGAGAGYRQPAQPYGAAAGGGGGYQQGPGFAGPAGYQQQPAGYQQQPAGYQQPGGYQQPPGYNFR